jgi:hypothetical protein
MQNMKVSAELCSLPEQRSVPLKMSTLSSKVSIDMYYTLEAHLPLFCVIQVQQLWCPWAFEGNDFK